MDLTHARLRSIPDVVCALRKVETLTLTQNLIPDMKPLSGLTTLRQLDLYDNELKAIDGLEGMSSLTCVGRGGRERRKGGKEGRGGREGREGEEGGRGGREGRMGEEEGRGGRERREREEEGRRGREGREGEEEGRGGRQSSGTKEKKRVGSV